MPESLPDSGAHSSASRASFAVISGARTERRIARLTLAIGLATAAMFLFAGRGAWAGGIGIGSALSWLNFRWLGRGLDALVAASIAQNGGQNSVQNDAPNGGAQDGMRPNQQKAQVPLSTYFTALFRYGLIALCVYTSFSYLHLPLGSLLVGLCALGAAAIAGSVYEILRPAG
jgi:hypothetical protein